MPGRGACILKQTKAAAFILIGQTEGYFGMSDAPIQVETPSIFGAFGSPVPKGNAMVYLHAVRLEGPDAYRPIADAGHIPAIVRSAAVLDEDVTAITRHNAVAAVIGQVSRVSWIILHPAILYENMIAIMRTIRPFYGNPGITIVPGHCAEYLYVRRPVDIYSRLLKAIDQQVAGCNMLTAIEDQAALSITVLSACAPKLQAEQHDIGRLVQRHGGAIAPIDHGPARSIRGNDDRMLRTADCAVR